MFRPRLALWNDSWTVSWVFVSKFNAMNIWHIVCWGHIPYTSRRTGSVIYRGESRVGSAKGILSTVVGPVRVYQRLRNARI